MDAGETFRLIGIAATVTAACLVAIGWLADRLEARKVRHDPDQDAANGDCFPHPVIDRVRPEARFSEATIIPKGVHDRGCRTAPTAGQRETIGRIPAGDFTQ